MRPLHGESVRGAIERAFLGWLVGLLWRLVGRPFSRSDLRAAPGSPSQSGLAPKLTLRHLRSLAIRQTLFPETTLRAAIDALGFVQADPIRAPARAQDLILRQRVQAYRAGDLERHYPSLDLEEGVLYAYGFLRRPLWQLRHPPNRARLPLLERKVLDAALRLGTIHPEALRGELGRKRILNAWGAYSSAATLALERLHRRGLLRVVRRDNGIRVYALCPPPVAVSSPAAAFRQLLLGVTQLLAPVSEASLRAATAPLARALRQAGECRAILAGLVSDGALERETIDGETYVWPAAEGSAAGDAMRRAPVESAARVRFLAPFDPVVWDRRRFEHLWGWAYRFEAYTPVAKRQRGYYALPLLWRDGVIGWANLKVVESSLDVELGFVTARPREAAFRVELDAEVERTRDFLALGESAQSLSSRDAARPSPAPRPRQ